MVYCMSIFQFIPPYRNSIQSPPHPCGSNLLVVVVVRRACCAGQLGCEGVLCVDVCCRAFCRRPSAVRCCAGVLGAVVLFLEDVTYLLSISIFLPSDYYR